MNRKAFMRLLRIEARTPDVLINVEHLVMIGGPTDVVLESRVVAAGDPPQRALPPPEGNRMRANTQPQPRPDAQQTRQEPRHEPQTSALQSAEPPRSTDQAFAEMAHQLVALRKPIPRAEGNEAREPRPAAMPRAEPFAGVNAPAAPPPVSPSQLAVAVPLSAPRSVRANVDESKPPRGEAKPQASGEKAYDSLEEDIASLLGRSSADN